jgi:hypothetical protein
VPRSVGSSVGEGGEEGVEAGAIAGAKQILGSERLSTEVFDSGLPFDDTLAEVALMSSVHRR